MGSLNSQKEFISNLEPPDQKTLDHFPGQEYLTQSYIYEWLQGLPDSTTKIALVQRQEIRSPSPSPSPSKDVGNFWPPRSLVDSSIGSQRHGLDSTDARDIQDSASIAWSARMSASSDGSYMSFASLCARRGRRILVHPNSSSESCSIRKRSRDTGVRETRHAKKSRTAENHLTSKSGKYCCTFCGSEFSRAFLWRRQ